MISSDPFERLISFRIDFDMNDIYNLVVRCSDVLFRYASKLLFPHQRLFAISSFFLTYFFYCPCCNCFIVALQLLRTVCCLLAIKRTFYEGDFVVVVLLLV